MTYDNFLKELQSGRIRNVYLFCGEDEFIKQNALTLVLGRLDETMREFNSVKLESPPLERVIMECEQLPMMSEKRIVVVYNFAPFKNAQGKEAEAYIKSLPQTVCLVFYEQGEPEQKALYRAIEQAGAVVLMNKLSPSRASAWVLAFAQKQGCIIAPGMADELVAMTDGSMLQIMTAATRLCDYAGSGEVTAKALGQCMQKTLEYDRIRAMNAFLAGDFSTGIALVKAKLLEGGSGDAIGLLSAFGYKLNDLLRAKHLASSMREEQAAQALGGHPYAAKMTVRDAKKFQTEKLADAVIRFADADYGVKTGKIDAQSALMLALTEVFSS